MDIDVVKPNYEAWQPNMEGMVEDLYSKIFIRDPLALAQKSLEDLNHRIDSCQTVEDLREFIETNVRLDSVEGKNFYDEVVNALSENANLRSIKDTDFMVLISSIKSGSETVVVKNAGADKRYKRFMIKGEGSVYFLGANEVIPVDLLSKIWGLFSVKVMNDYSVEQELRLKDVFPPVEFSKRKSFTRGLENVLRYAFNKLFNEFQRDLVDSIDFKRSFAFSNILREVLLLNRHLSLSVDSKTLLNSKVSIYFPENGETVALAQIIGSQGNYFYVDMGSRITYVLDPRSDYLIFKRQTFEKLERIAKENAKRFFSDMVNMFMGRLIRNKYNGFEIPDLEVKTVVAIKGLAHSD